MQIISTFDSSVPTMRMRNGLMRKSREASIQMFTIISMVALHAHECIPHTTCNLCVCRVASRHREKWKREKEKLCERSVCAQRVYANSAKRTLFRVVLQIKSKQREEKEFYVHFFFRCRCCCCRHSVSHSFNSRIRHLCIGGGCRSSPKSHLLHYAQNGNMYSCTIVLR